MEGSLDENRELPGHFLHELYKWALECEFKGLSGFGWGLSVDDVTDIFIA